MVAACTRCSWTSHQQHTLLLLLLLLYNSAVWLYLVLPQTDPGLNLLFDRSLKQSRVSRLGQLLGFARATSDGALSATIW
jgi:hypothetical protein